MRALADPTRRAVFERIARSDEITVVELTRGQRSDAGRDLAAPQIAEAGRPGRRTRPRAATSYYRAEPKGLAPLFDWMSHYGVFWRERFANLRTLLKEIDP